MSTDELVKRASKDLEQLLELKNLAVKMGMYELGAKCREVEKELYPVSDEEKQAQLRGKDLNLAFRMVDLNIPESVCYKIDQSLKQFNKLKGKFDTGHASKIVKDTERLFLRSKTYES